MEEGAKGQRHKGTKGEPSFLLGVVAVVLWTAGSGWGLVISEIMYHPAETQNLASLPGDETLEFIELYNDRAVSEELGGWSFTNGIDYVFEPNTLLGPKSYVVIARDPAAVEAAYGITGVLGPFTGRLNNDGERVELSNANGGIVLSLRYNNAHPWPVSADGAGHSLILAGVAADPENASSWSAGTQIGGTPGAPDQVQVQAADPTVVTLIDTGHIGRYFKGTREPSPGGGGSATAGWTLPGFDDDPSRTAWLEGPSGYGYSSDVAELQYVRTQLPDMNGSYISVYARLPFTLTGEQIASFSQLTAEVRYDDGFVLYLNGVRVGDSGNLAGIPPAFNQNASTAFDYSPMTVDLTGHKDLLVAGNNVLAIQAHNSAVSGSSDFVCGVALRGIIEPPAVSDDPRSRLVINEVLAHGAAAGAVGWIELHNPGPIPVDLGTAYLSDDRLNLLKYRLPAGVVLQPGRFWAIYAGTSPGLPFALDVAGGTLYLTSAGNGPASKPVRVLDAMRYGVTEPDVTYGRFPDGSSYLGPLAAATRQTPNAQRTVGDIVINEIMYQHAMRQEQYEYVELYNRSGQSIPLAGWSLTDAIEYQFDDGAVIGPDSYLVVAKDPDFLAALYDNLVIGTDLLGPYSGNLGDHSERICLLCPVQALNPQTGRLKTYTAVADEVTYWDGGRWPAWADGTGASMELRDPRSDNDTPEAWADSDESGKTTWKRYSYSIPVGDNRYTYDGLTTFDMMLLNAGQVLVDDLELVLNGANRLNNAGFENLPTVPATWRILGNHERSFVTTADRHSGSRCLHLIATGHGDPGANRINQTVANVNTRGATFSFWARWLRGSRFLLLRTTRDLSPVQPPRPSYAFELDMPLDLGTPGRRNTAYVANRGPDILEVKHLPVLPRANEPITVTARVMDNDSVASVTLYHRVEGAGAFASTPMVDTGQAGDTVAGDGVYSAVMTNTPAGRVRAFYIVASDGSADTRFPTLLDSTAKVPERTCLVRVGDTAASTRIASYRIWMSNDVVNAFRSRANLSNELLDCTFVYNGSEVFYNCGLRRRGSPFLRNGSGWDPAPGDRRGWRIDFRPDQQFRDRDEVNLDGCEGSGRGPLQERAAYWLYEKMGLQYSRQEYVRLIMNGRAATNMYEDVWKIDGHYVDAWFPSHNEGLIHKIDDYFEYDALGTSHRNLDEGLKYDAQHPLIPETYRWGFEKRSHPEEDQWQHLFNLAVALNRPSTDPGYEPGIEALMDPRHFAMVLAIRHAVGDWDSYGYTRGKNNAFYYSLPEGKWYLLPWDIDFAFGSGDGATTSLFSVTANEFPEVNRFLNYSKYRAMYLQAFGDLVNGPWRTSYGTANPPTAFDRFVDEAAAVLIAEGAGDGRRNAIKQFVRDRRAYIISQVGAVAPQPQPPSVPPRR